MSNAEIELKRFDRFIDNWSHLTGNPADRALICLMKHHRADIAPLFAQRDPHWFHKAFRQTDVCDSSTVDVMIWNLIHACSDFWDELHYEFSDRRDPQGKRALQRQLDAARAEIEALRKSQHADTPQGASHD